MATEKKTLKGSCQCGQIKYTCDAPVTPDGHLAVTRCNCTFCQKLSTTNLNLAGLAADFHLLSPASAADDSVIGSYGPPGGTVHRHFCKTCSAVVWFEGFFVFGGQRRDLFIVNLATVDQPQEGVDLKTATKITYWDGLKNNFGAGPKDEPWPCGLL